MGVRGGGGGGEGYTLINKLFLFRSSGGVCVSVCRWAGVGSVPGCGQANDKTLTVNR